MRAHPLVACAIALLAACAPAKSFLVPVTKTPEERAHELSDKCVGATDDALGPLLHPSGIDTVEPLYAYVMGGPNGREARMRGAKLHVKPADGLTREAIARGLECHESHVILGRGRVIENDPYVLPQRWLDIDVENEKYGFAVLVQTNDIDDAKAALARARAFMGSGP